MKMTIVGAGMAGLIAANMLRRHNVLVVEKAASLPNNHSAVLRFRTTAVSDATGIPFNKETVHKGLWKDGKVVNECTIEDLNRYSLMVTDGNLFNRSIFNLKSGERWCAPRDFVEQMAKNIDINFGFDFDPAFGMKHKPDRMPWNKPVISTIPMPMMMDLMGWRDEPLFRFLPVWTVKAQFNVPISNVCQTLYQTQRDSWYRATIHGQELTLELMFEPWKASQKILCHQAIAAFGIHQHCFSQEIFEVNKLPIGKILPIDETVRKRFLLWLTEKHNIYSLGRFATWRNILLDDIVQDVKRIESMIEKQSTYEMR